MQTTFRLGKKDLTAVRGVSLEVKKGRTLVILGESGSGKSVLLKTILRLLDEDKTTITGKVEYNQKNIIQLPEQEMAKLRGKQIGMIYQNALTAMDPVFKVGHQLDEVIEKHISPKERKKKVIQAFKDVGIPSPEERIDAYPHELSGGMRQRAVIAMSLISHPDILLADEPTTALDVTIQSQILHLLKKIQTEFGTTIVFVTHDIGVAAALADDIAVMYAGNIVEYGKADDVLYTPNHPYTKGLIDATPQRGRKKQKLVSIPGEPPSLLRLPKGCAFAPRCSFATQKCLEKAPASANYKSNNVACYYPLQKTEVNTYAKDVSL
nr:ABC transporter ATP-binding protein [Aquibacillus albus]